MVWFGMTPRQSRVARALLDWSQDDARKAADVSLRWLEGFETPKRGKRPSLRQSTVDALQRAYEGAGIVFDRDGVNVRLEAKAKGRKQ